MELFLRAALEEIFEAKIPAGEQRHLGGRAVWLAMEGPQQQADDVVKDNKGQDCAAAGAILEEVLVAAGHGGSKATVQAAKHRLRLCGEQGQKLAARIGKVSKARNSEIHETSLPAEVASCLSAASSDEAEAVRQPKTVEYNELKEPPCPHEGPCS